MISPNPARYLALSLALTLALCLALIPVLAAEDPGGTSDAQAVAPSSACSDSRLSPEKMGEEDFAAWLDRIGAEALEPDAAVRTSVPSCPDVQPCAGDCVPGEGPCFIKPLGSSECCTPEGCFRCEGETEIFVVTCPCLGAGCPRRSLELICD